MSINTTRVLFHKTMVSLNVYAHPAMHSQTLDQKQCRCLERSTAYRSMSPQLNKTYPMFSSWSRLQHRSVLRTASVYWSCHFPPPCYDNEKGAYRDSVKTNTRNSDHWWPICRIATSSEPCLLGLIGLLLFLLFLLFMLIWVCCINRHKQITFV